MIYDKVYRLFKEADCPEEWIKFKPTAEQIKQL